ncbi:DNA polymerase III subunit delta [Stakelama sediminis]|uniref:DNA-directed DNA polymerase n=1 Tax=Stakelama sediminis TaxID=463200 RepID=A0A840Z0E4_9SPHN|nr:DNA polymerase III subunit delta [Stakelama sediminis]MBB5719257.1 DNA polymerase-3 subunit delta [Stakelama sediminis]
MKVSANSIAGHIDRPSPDIRAWLFHGSDEAGAEALAKRLEKTLGADVERIDIDPAMLRSQPGLLQDEAASMSLFGTRRYVRVAGAGEESLAALQQLIDAPQSGEPVVLIAPGVKTSGKLVKLALASPAVIACACYVPEGRNAIQLAISMAQEAGVRLTGETAARLWDAAGGDRAIVASEIEKLALYLDATPDAPKEAGLAALEAVGADLESDGLFDAIAAILAGDAPKTANELHLMEDGNLSIPFLRQLARRLTALAALRAEVDAGNSIGTVIEKHRVFFKERDATASALQRWDSRRIAQAMERVREVERQIMAPATPGPVLAAQLGITAARAAGRSRR